MLFLAVIFYAPIVVFGQQPNTGATIEFKPPYPRPGETVTATITNLPGTVSGQSTEWRIDGTIIEEAANQRSITLTANSIDTPMRVTATVGGLTLENTLRPVYLDLIIEPQTYVPNFYIGRAVPSLASQINVTALVNGTAIDPASLQFFWRLNLDVLEGGPVRGKNKLSINLPRYESRNILTVEASIPGGRTVARRSFLIPLAEPTLQFYEYDSLYGLASRPLLNNQLVLVGNSATIRAVPYNLDTRVFNDPAILEWRINNTITNTNTQNPYEITVQRQFGAGTTPINFRLSDTRIFSQAAQGKFSISY